MVPPDKLVVATSEPAIAMRRAPKREDLIIKSFRALGLKHPLLSEGAEKLDPGTCRLDLSGDTHHYERYDGNADPHRDDQDQEPDLAHGAAPAPMPYASVVSGLGGAFFHPSDIHFSGPSRRAVFPPREVSRIEIARRLLNPWSILHGGHAAKIGALSSAILALALFKSASCRSAFDYVLRLLLPLTKAPSAPDLALRHFVKHLYVLLSLAILTGGLYASNELLRWCRNKPGVPKRSPVWHGIGIGLAVASVLAPIVATFLVGAESARSMAVDVGVFLLLIVLLFGLVLFAILGASGHRWPRVVGFCLLGLSHGLVQAALPLTIVRSGALWTVVPLAGVPWVLLFLRSRLAAWWPRGALLVVWLAVILGIFLAVRAYAQPGGYLPTSPAAIISVVAGVLVVGSYLSAFWLGFYLAVSHELHGHYNDVGSAARINKFQEFIRFRLTKRELTGYVIRIDEPKLHGRDLKPRIIDKFTVTPG
jgi:hypothetical protein